MVSFRAWSRRGAGLGRAVHTTPGSGNRWVSTWASLALLALAGCGQGQPTLPSAQTGRPIATTSPSAIATPSPTLVASPTEIATQSASARPSLQPGVATFRLWLVGTPRDTAGFQLYLDTDPPSMGQTRVAFCGEFAQPCQPSKSPFVSRTVGFSPTTVLVYRFERVSSDNVVHVLAQGRAKLGAGLVREYRYVAN